MFYQQYIRFKTLNEKLLKKFIDHERMINQDITIRDIFVYPHTDESYGESKNNKNIYQHYPVLGRLIDHLELLANITNEYHQQYFCDKNEDDTYTIKSDCLNKITRLLLNEFALYTIEPIKMDDFTLLVETIHAIASAKQANVHLLLSSMAVLTKDNKILNMSLYIQCGSEPKIDAFCKGTSSDKDIRYEKKMLFKQQNVKNQFDDSCPYISSENGVIISSNTVLSITTEGNAKYIQAIDVCLDHAKTHSKTLLKKIALINAHYNQEIIPRQVDHIVTSNSIDIIESSRISASTIQIDPEEIVTTFIETDLIKELDKDKKAEPLLNKFKKNKYDKMSIQETTHGFLIKNPAFGCDFKIIPMRERMLGEFSDDLKPIIKHANNRIQHRTRQFNLQQIAGGKEYNTLINERAKIFDQLNNLDRYILNKLKPTFLEELFHTESYQLKLKIKDIWIEATKNLKKISNDPAYFIHNHEIILTKLKTKLQHINVANLNKTLIDLTSKIDDLISKPPSHSALCIRPQLYNHWRMI